MLAFNKLIFDFNIPGTGTWYSPCTFDDLLGTADAIFLMVHTLTHAGTSPTITCQLQHSATGRKFTPVNATAEINAQALVANTVIESTSPTSLVTITPYLRFVQVKMTIGGSGSLGGRVKIYATGRVSGAAKAAQPSPYTGAMM